MRYLAVIFGLLVLVGALVAIKVSQIGSIMAYGEQAQAAGPPPEPVATAEAKLASLGGVITAVGSVASSRGVAVSTEVPGVVTQVRFESGQAVKAGEVLVRLDTSVERAQLASAEARRDLALVTVERTRELVTLSALSAQQRDADESELKGAVAQVDQLRAQIARKTIRAPFRGRIGIRAVNLGQYLGPGTPVAVLETQDTLYVDFSLPQQRVGEVREGMPIRVQVEGQPDHPLTGTVVAIEPAVDSSTRQVRVRGHVPQPEGLLRSGMFVTVSLLLGEGTPTVIVPLTAIVHASYGDSVFVVADKDAEEPGMRNTPSGASVRTARQHFVKLGAEQGDFVSILAGVEAGAEVVVAGAFKLRNGGPIVVDNSVLPEASQTPNLPNR